MRSNLRRVATAAGLAVLLGGTLATPAAGARSTSSSAPERYDVRIVDYSVVPERPEGTLRPGDQVLWVAELFQEGERVGTAPHHCTSVNDVHLACESVLVLADGQITFQTVIDTTSSATVVRIPVTGGSERYRDASGQVVVRTTGGTTQVWRLRLSGS